MAYVYNHMPEEFYQDRAIGAMAKLVLQRIFSLSKDGEQTVFFNREKYAHDLGCNKDTITKAYKDLVEAGYIEQIHNKNPFDRTLRFKVVKSTLETNKITDNRETRQREDSQRNNQQSDNREYQDEEFGNQITEDFGDLHQIEKRKNIEKEEDRASSSSLTFDSVFSQMLKINEEEFTPKGTGFAEEDIRSDARTYTMKFKGKPTRDSMYKWMISGDERRREQRKTQLESNQNSTVPLPKKMTAAQIRAGLLAHQKKYGPASPFHVGGDYEY